jgi:hypothetical protein
MDNKDSGSNLALWIPGSAVILSLVVSAFALNRAPFFEPRPVGEKFQAEQRIEARLWQDPFDALERYRKKLKDSGSGEKLCSETLAPMHSDGVEDASGDGGAETLKLLQKRQPLAGVSAAGRRGPASRPWRRGADGRPGAWRALCR